MKSKLNFYLTILCVGIFIFTSVATGLASDTGTKGTIKIGVVTVLSGAGAPIGDRLLSGVKFAVDERPVINGYKIEIVVQDSAGDPSLALQKVTELAGDKDVVALTGLSYSQEAAAIAGALMAGRLALPYIDGNNVGNEVTGKFCNDWTFRISPNISAMINAAKKFFEARPKIGNTGWYIIGSDSAYGKGISDSFKNIGMNILGVNLAPLDMTDWTPIINRAMSSGANALWLPINFGSPLAQFVKQAHTLGLTKKMTVVLPIGFPFLEELQQLGDAAVGMLGCSLWTEMTIESVKPVAKKFFDKTGKAPSQQTLQQIKVTNVLLDAIEAVNTPTRENIRDALANMEFKTDVGPLKFRQPDQQAIVNIFQGSIQKLDEPLLGYKYSWVIDKTISTAEILPSPEEAGCKK